MRRLIALIWYRLGLWLDARGLGAVASSCYQLAGSKGGRSGALALVHVGKHLLERERFQDALATFDQATRHDPNNPDAWCGLGIAFRRLAQFDQARRSFDRALEIAPDHPRALTNTGELLYLQKQPEAALGYFDRVLALAPNFQPAMEQRLAALAACGKLAEAEQAARQALEIFPDSADMLERLGSILVRADQPRQAMFAFQQALAIQPDHLEAQLNLANLMGDKTTLMELEDYIREKIEQQGESLSLLESLALGLIAKQHLIEAASVCRKLVARDPEFGRGWMASALCADAWGDARLAIEYFNKVAALAPQDGYLHSNALFMTAYLSEITPEAAFSSHQAWARRHEDPLLERQYSHAAGGDPDKRLKIGYVSRDLGFHPVGDLLRGVLQQHDHARFEIHCFMTSEGSDQATARLRADCDAWHEVPWLTRDDLAALIHSIGIDILVDLSGHTGGNRLTVFALKPAPIQASWIGYFHSTGMRSIDYFITDPFTTPLDCGQLFSEIPVRLPHSRFCFTPREHAPEVSSPPFEQSGFVTFGSFNRLAKLNDEVLDAWGSILSGVPDARIMIKDMALDDAGVAGQLKARFAERGIAAERIIIRAHSDYLAMLGEYGEVDIALDPFPFNGGMTTMDALWMGVPVVALAGNGVVSRQSLSLLTNIGHTELVFRDVESYIAGAVALAQDAERLAHLRQTIRPHMSRSPLCDAEQFTSDLEALYRRMWQAWCRGTKLGPEIVPGPPVARRLLPHDNPALDIQLQRLFQRRWQNVKAPDNRKAPPDILGSAENRIEVICATRLPEKEFWEKSALGISLRRLGTDTRLVAHVEFENQRGLPEVYNEQIDRDDSCNTLVFVHDDVWIDDQFLADHVTQGLASFDVIGVAGNRRRVLDQPGWRFISASLQPDTTSNLSGRVAHDKHPFGGVSVFGSVPAECELLDGVFLAARKAPLREADVRFDPRFDFHFYDMDFCRSARDKGLRLGTWAISLTHQSEGSFGSPQWLAKLRLYQEKWQT